MAEAVDELQAGVRDGWARFIDRVEPFRADLFRYGQRLTGNAVDAEALQKEEQVDGVRPPQSLGSVLPFAPATAFWQAEGKGDRQGADGGEHDESGDEIDPASALRCGLDFGLLRHVFDLPSRWLRFVGLGGGPEPYFESVGPWGS